MSLLLNACLQLTSHTILLDIQSKKGVNDGKENSHIHKQHPVDPVKSIHEETQGIAIQMGDTLRIESGPQITG
jgi:hypothetical protein